MMYLSDSLLSSRSITFIIGVMLTRLVKHLGKGWGSAHRLGAIGISKPSLHRAILPNMSIFITFTCNDGGHWFQNSMWMLIGWIYSNTACTLDRKDVSQIAMEGVCRTQRLLVRLNKIVSYLCHCPAIFSERWKDNWHVPSRHISFTFRQVRLFVSKSSTIAPFSYCPLVWVRVRHLIAIQWNSITFLLFYRVVIIFRKVIAVSTQIGLIESKPEVFRLQSTSEIFLRGRTTTLSIWCCRELLLGQISR